MSATLSQTAEAAFPDRPRLTAGTGLRIDLSVGNDGQTLAVALTSPIDPLDVRLMIHPVDIAGGRVALMRGGDDSTGRIAELIYDADGRTVELALADGSSLVADVVSGGPAWHCVEWSIDRAAGSAALWLDGRLRQSVSGLGGLAAITELLVGAVAKDTDTTGRIDLDEMVIADAPVGPVMVTPDSPFADDPARWLVVYNAADADSRAWAESYRAARAVPYANCCGLDLPTSETISESQFIDLRDAVAAYLADNQLAGQVLGILLGHGVPGYYLRTDGRAEAIAGQLHRIDGQTDPVTNPLSLTEPIARPDAALLDGDRLVARIDGPTIADSIALIDRAAALESTGLADGSDATLWFDPVTTGTLYEGPVADWLDWAGGVDRQRLGLPFQQTSATDPPSEAAFASIDHDGFFWGWRDDLPPAGFFADPPGRRVFCFQATDTTATSPTLRAGPGGGWTAAAMGAGYAAAAGSSRDYTLTGVPRPDRFFAALRNGWTLGEAWGLACPLWREALELVGDPLLCIALPHAGWQVFGPFEPGGAMRCDQPIAVVRLEQTAWPIDPAHQPAEGQTATYRLCRIDAMGRAVDGGRILTVRKVNGELVAVPAPPAWPEAGGWSAERVGDLWRMRFVFARPATDADITTLELIEQPVGQAEQTVEQRAVTDKATLFTFDRPVVGQVRYRLRVRTAAGAWAQTPWSQWLEDSVTEVQTVALFTA